MPALPLHEAGGYVAAAYVVLLGIVLLYVAIMAGRLARIERDLGAVDELVDRASDTSATVDGGGRPVLDAQTRPTR